MNIYNAIGVFIFAVIVIALISSLIFMVKDEGFKPLMFMFGCAAASTCLVATAAYLMSI